jgi:hypothetical protein
VNVVVTGPESSGTRFVSRWLETHPDVVARHWSMPSGEQWARHWPTDHDFGGEWPDAVVVCVRSFEATIASQHARELVGSRKEAEQNIVTALLRSLSWCVSHGAATYLLSYDELVAHPESFARVFRWLGLDPVDPPEPVIDANTARLR